MIERRNSMELELLRLNKLEKTMQLQFWKKRPNLVHWEISKVNWPPSVHQLGELHILFIVGQPDYLDTEQLFDEEGKVKESWEESESKSEESK